MQKFILIITLSLLLLCCQSQNPELIVVNNSGDLLTEIEVGVSPKMLDETDSLADGQEFSTRLHFDSSIKSDGAYVLKFERNGSVIHETFGYYTNGIPLDTRIRVKIEPDTMVFEFH